MLAIRVVAELLDQRGAKVVIGDQSGIRHLLHHPGGVLRGSTKENYAQSDTGVMDDARFVSFEDGGDGTRVFNRYQSPTIPSWPDGFFITRLAKKADHIISLPRVSTHSPAGATPGFACMVGMLLQDTRRESHANRPCNNFITAAAKRSTRTSRDDGTGTFL